MRVAFHGTRGSIATPGPETVAFGGDTSCVSITGDDPSHLIILDAGSGIRRLGRQIGHHVSRIDVLLSHLHLDHIIGLGFFDPLFRSDVVISIFAPPAASSLLDRLGRYLSPPLFPVRLRDVDCELELRDAPEIPSRRGEFSLSATSVIHPDVAVGYRIESDGHAIAYLPDHEPALSPRFPTLAAWTSGAGIAADADLLIHDAQYAPHEYEAHVGWGHSSVLHATDFARLVRARSLALFHHDPSRDDAAVESLTRVARSAAGGMPVVAARQGETIVVGRD